MSKVFFANSGSEANDTAIKMVWYFNNALGRPKKKKIIGRIKGYHGITVASGSLTGLPANHRSFDLPIPGFLHTMRPHYYHGAKPGESEEEFATRCADELEKLILAEGPDTVAAMIAEPVMGAGGVIVPPATYFEKIQAVLKKYDMLFVADEVICGFGRTGNYWGSQTLGHAAGHPDLRQGAVVVLPADLRGDGERAGLPGAGRARATRSAPSATASPIPAIRSPAAVALETLKIYDEIEHRRRMSAPSARICRAELRRRFADHPLVGEVRGVGLIGAHRAGGRQGEAHRTSTRRAKIGARAGQAAARRTA